MCTFSPLFIHTYYVSGGGVMGELVSGVARISRMGRGGGAQQWKWCAKRAEIFVYPRPHFETDRSLVALCGPRSRVSEFA